MENQNVTPPRIENENIRRETEFFDFVATMLTKPLPRTQRQILGKYLLEHKNPEEIREEMGISEISFKVSVNETLKNIKDLGFSEAIFLETAKKARLISEPEYPIPSSQTPRRWDFIKQSVQVKTKAVDMILLSTAFGGGFGLLLSGIIFTNGFLSWMGVICMALGLIHLISSP